MLLGYRCLEMTGTVTSALSVINEKAMLATGAVHSIFTQSGSLCEKTKRDGGGLKVAHGLSWLHRLGYVPGIISAAFPRCLAKRVHGGIKDNWGLITYTLLNGFSKPLHLHQMKQTGRGNINGHWINSKAVA